MNPNQLSLRLERIVRAIQGAGGHQNDSFVISILRIQPTNIHRSSSVVLTGFLLVIGFVSGYAAPPATETEATGKTELSGVISGRVLDQSGKPIPRAKAVLYQYKNPSQRFGHMVPEHSLKLKKRTLRPRFAIERSTKGIRARVWTYCLNPRLS